MVIYTCRCSGAQENVSLPTVVISRVTAPYITATTLTSRSRARVIRLLGCNNGRTGPGSYYRNLALHHQMSNVLLSILFFTLINY